MTPVQTPATVRVSRIIAASLIGGVTLFAIIAWLVVQESGPQASDPAAGPVMLYAWAGVAFASVSAAAVLWRLKVSPLIEEPRRGGPGASAAHDEALQTALIITWALLEGPALFGLVVYLLTAWIPAYAGGLLLGWLGIGLTFPRTAWYRNGRAQRSEI